MTICLYLHRKQKNILDLDIKIAQKWSIELHFLFQKTTFIIKITTLISVFEKKSMIKL